MSSSQLSLHSKNEESNSSSYLNKNKNDDDETTEESNPVLKQEKTGSDKKVYACEEHDVSSLLQTLTIKHKKLIVFSFGGVIVHRIYKYDARALSSTKRQPDFILRKYMIFKRSHLNDFIKFCYDRFEVAIWSSAMEHNIEGPLDDIFSKKKPLFIWNQEQCTETTSYSLHKFGKPIFLKDIRKISKKYPAYSSINTLLIDDEPCVSLINPPNTSIFPDKYYVSMKDDSALGPDGELRQYLDLFSSANDVPSFVKNNPFGQPPITNSHPYWRFYSKIINRYT